MNAIIKNGEVRGIEEKTSRKTGKSYLVVRVEDETGVAESFVDRDLSRKEYYQKGAIGDVYIKIKIGYNYTNIEIKDFKLKQ